MATYVERWRPVIETDIPLRDYVAQAWCATFILRSKMATLGSFAFGFAHRKIRETTERAQQDEGHRHHE